MMSIRLKHSDFIYSIYREQSVELPNLGEYATGILFIDAKETEQVKDVFTKMAKDFNLQVIKVIIGCGLSVHCSLNSR